MKYRDRTGKEIELAEWLGLNMTPEYAIVAKDTINGIEISTIWEGIQTGNSDQRARTFETMTFTEDPDKSDWNNKAWKWKTEEEALAGHEKVRAHAARVKTIIHEEDDLSDVLETARITHPEFHCDDPRPE